jgi:colanic acid biosynthesis glycosyl transferase WcaI
MKILIITDTFPPEKVGSYRMHDLAVNLSKDGFQVTVLCPPPTFPFGNFKRTWKLAKISFLENFKLVNLWTWQPQSDVILYRAAYYTIMPLIAIIWILGNREFDVIITSSGASLLTWLPGFLSKRLFRKPWIIDVRDLPVESAIDLGFLKNGGLITHFLRKYEVVSYSNSDMVLVTTESACRAVKSYNILDKKVFLIPNASEIATFYPLDINKKRQIIYSGNIGHAQDFDCVLSAMNRIAAHNLQLLIIGEGDVKKRLSNLISANHLTESVKLMDGVERSKLPYLLSESIIGIAPIRNVGVGVGGSIPAKVFDYMACAIPFIAFGGADLRQLAENSGSGLVVENDPDSLADAVIFLAENPKICEEMGQRGRKYCEKYYNRRLTAKKVESLLYSLNDKVSNNEESECFGPS